MQIGCANRETQGRITGESGRMGSWERSSRLGRVTLKMYSFTVTNYFIKKVFSNVIQVPQYESNVTDYFWITSMTDIIFKLLFIKKFTALI